MKTDTNTIFRNTTTALIALMLAVSLLVVFGAGNAQAATKRLACDDGLTLLPASPSQGFNPNTYCANYGGYSSKEVTLCDGGNKIIPPLFRGDAAAYCADDGGLTPINSPSTTATSNTSCPDNDCEFFAPVDIGNKEGAYQCGKGARTVTTGFNLGCRGESYPAINANPIIDMAFGIFRYLSAGVGLVLIGSIILAGIQYSASRGNPQAVEASIKRITSTFIALLIYVFMFAIANFLVPGGILI